MSNIYHLQGLRLKMSSLPYEEFLKASYDHLLHMSKELDNPEEMTKAKIAKKSLETLVITTMIEIKEKLYRIEMENNNAENPPT